MIGVAAKAPVRPAPLLMPQDPFATLAEGPEGGVLALIVGVEGPSYRPLGAGMAFFSDGARVGTLSSGCIEADLAIHAAAVRESGRSMQVRYGTGSPFGDIALPCGGGLDIALLPRPDRAVLRRLMAERAARRPSALSVDPGTGAMAAAGPGRTGLAKGRFTVHFPPELRFLVFGKGPEAATFTTLVAQAGYPNLLLSPDPETRAIGAAAGCATRPMVRAAMPEGLAPDAWTAIVLFFHDHEWEPPILAAALQTDAFYIGAQGSQRARAARDMDLAEAGVATAALSRLRGPIGLIPSARDPRTLAISVLAEVLDVAREAAA